MGAAGGAADGHPAARGVSVFLCVRWPWIWTRLPWEAAGPFASGDGGLLACSPDFKQRLKSEISEAVNIDTSRIQVIVRACVCV